MHISDDKVHAQGIHNVLYTPLPSYQNKMGRKFPIILPHKPVEDAHPPLSDSFCTHENNHSSPPSTLSIKYPIAEHPSSQLDNSIPGPISLTSPLR